MHAYRSYGFTLVELLIVVALIAILAMVALPAYNEQVLKTHRNIGKNELLDLAARQERYYSQFGYYGRVQDITDSASSSYVPEGGKYTITVGCSDVDGNAAACGSAAARPQGFTLTATPDGSLSDTYCGNFTITHASERGISGNSAHMDACWN